MLDNAPSKPSRRHPIYFEMTAAFVAVVIVASAECHLLTGESAASVSAVVVATSIGAATLALVALGYHLGTRIGRCAGCDGEA
ncbi:MAG: hypothetical protein IT495_03640 [Gammaproteobacteria bacterium]|nr:hypothetical protein [Gammaproteobacteria bacterium]